LRGGMRGYPTSLGGMHEAIPPRLYAVMIDVLDDWVG
jgi:hypothetical protein